MFIKKGKELFNNDWVFMLREPHALFPELDPTVAGKWASVELPHDWLAFKKASSYKAADGWYKKEFTLPPSLQDSPLGEGGRVADVIELAFDGINAECSVYVNNTLVLEEYDEGNSGFVLNISRHVKSGVNTVHVRVNHKARSRVHTGAGIYRNVWLIKHSSTHIVSENFGGIAVTTLMRGNGASWKVRVGVDYFGEPDFFRYFLYAPDGTQLAVAESGRDYVFEIALGIAWDFNTPALYTVKAQLVKGDRIVDEASRRFPFRTFAFHEELAADEALLNSRVVKLRGVEVNDSFGALGAAFNTNALLERLVKLRDELGCNAICAANSDTDCLSPELYALCDELGILILAGDGGVPYDSLFDSAGGTKPAYYRTKSLWSKELKECEPFVKIFPHWDWNVGQTVSVSVYSNLSKLELFLNGKSLGRKIVDFESGELAAWQVKYECGELVARGYDVNGGIAAATRISSFWDATELRASAASFPEKLSANLSANGRDLVFVDISAYDDAGEFVANANNRVSVQISGDALRLVGFENGDEFDYDSRKADNRRLFEGRARAILQTSLESGKASVQISSRGLKETSLEFVVAEAQEVCGVSVADLENYYDFGYADTDGDANSAARSEIPARKVELVADSTTLSRGNPAAKIKAEIFPANSDYTNVDWLCEFDDEYNLDYEDVADALKVEGNGIWCNVCLGENIADLPTRFRICAFCRGSGTSQTVSEIEMRVEMKVEV